MTFKIALEVFVSDEALRVLEPIYYGAIPTTVCIFSA